MQEAHVDALVREGGLFAGKGKTGAEYDGEEGTKAIFTFANRNN